MSQEENDREVQKTDDLMSRLQSVLSDEESMAQLNQLAQMLTGGEQQSGNSGAAPAPSPPPSPASDLPDIGMLMKAGQLLQGASDDENVKFLMALRPLLKEESRVKLDRVIKIFRLIAVYPAIKESGLISIL